MVTYVFQVSVYFVAGKDPGGIPSMIFKLTSLETLDLSYTAITHLPGMAREILTLQTINLEHCPLLEGIDGNVGLLPNLKSKYSLTNVLCWKYKFNARLHLFPIKIQGRRICIPVFLYNKVWGV